MNNVVSNELEKMIRRIASKVGQPDLASMLSEKLQPTDLQSLLLYVYAVRAAKLTSGDIWRLGRQHHLVQS